MRLLIVLGLGAMWWLTRSSDTNGGADQNQDQGGPVKPPAGSEKWQVKRWMTWWADNPSQLPSPATGAAKTLLIQRTFEGAQSARAESIERMHGTWGGIFDAAVKMGQG